MAAARRKSIEAWEEELMAYGKAEKWELLGERAKICIEQYPKSAIGYHFTICALIFMGKAPEALKIYQKSSQNKIVNQTIMSNIFPLVIEISDKTQLEKMNETLTQDFVLDDDTASDFLLIRGMIRAKLSDFNGAVKDFTHCLKERPEYVDALINRGAAYYDLGEYDLGLVDLDKAIQLDTTRPNAYLNRGNIYVEFKRNKDAISDYGKALALDANYTKAYINRGLTFYDLNRYAKGVVDFDTALRLEPNNHEAIINAIRGYEIIENTQKIYEILQLIDEQSSLTLDSFKETIFDAKIASLDRNFDVIKNHLPNKKPYDYYSLLLFLSALYESTLKNSLEYILLNDQNCEPNVVKSEIQARKITPFKCVNLIKNLLSEDELKAWQKFFEEKIDIKNDNLASPVFQTLEAGKIRNDVIHGNGSSNGNLSWNKITKVTESQCIYACYVMLGFLSEYLKLFQNEIIKSNFNPMQDIAISGKRHVANKMSEQQTKYFLHGLYAASNN